MSIFNDKTSRILNIASLIGAAFSASCHATALYIGQTRNKALGYQNEYINEMETQLISNSEDICGIGKTNKILDAVIQREVSIHHPKEAEIEETKFNSALCYDVYRKRYFRSDIEEIRQAIERLNASTTKTTLNRLLFELHLPYYGAAGEVLGWNGPIDIYYCSCLTSDRLPVFAINYKPEIL